MSMTNENTENTENTETEEVIEANGNVANEPETTDITMTEKWLDDTDTIHDWIDDTIAIMLDEDDEFSMSVATTTDKDAPGKPRTVFNVYVQPEKIGIVIGRDQTILNSILNVIKVVQKKYDRRVSIYINSSAKLQ